ncbi:MAG: cupin domain-containing protein [Woeseia sp.]
MHNSIVKGGGTREEVWTGERCFITELMNDPAIPEVSLAQCRVPPGTTTQLHRLSVDEWYVVDQGSGLMAVGSDTPFQVVPGDTITVPAGVSQRITNTGDSDLVFQCVCIPRFTPGSYESLEADCD